KVGSLRELLPVLALHLDGWNFIWLFPALVSNLPRSPLFLSSLFAAAPPHLESSVNLIHVPLARSSMARSLITMLNKTSKKQQQWWSG
uniref:Uncharacterized protein n=1 Tax=Chrysemys picta bellii TaxID=8478 RepID=A0A8C3PDS0_CHRPI